MAKKVARWTHICPAQDGTIIYSEWEYCSYCHMPNQPGKPAKSLLEAIRPSEIVIDDPVVGMKFDNDKIRPALVLGDFAQALQQVSAVGKFGAKKYADNNWLSVKDGTKRYQDAMLRHYLAWCTGEVNDPESGLPHLAHMAWNALAVTELIARIK